MAYFLQDHKLLAFRSGVWEDRAGRPEEGLGALERVKGMAAGRLGGWPRSGCLLTMVPAGVRDGREPL